MMNHRLVKWIFLVLISLPVVLAGQTTSSPSSQTTQAGTTNNAAPSGIILLAGTRLLVMLKLPLHTTSAESGSGVYSETASVIVQDSRVVVPLKSQVQGKVESEQRPGRVKGRARFAMRFDTLVLPNNYAVPIDASLQSIPGSNQLRRKKNSKSIEPVDQIDKDLARIAAPTFAGAAIGSFHSLGPGTFLGAGAGALFGLGATLFTRGDEIRLPAGTTLEIVLQQPVTLDAGRLP